MLSKRFGSDFLHKLILTGYFGLAVGLPLSKIILSLSTIWLILVLLIEADFKNYFQKVKENRIISLLFVFLGLQLLSFFWSSDLQYALKDLNAKLPLFAIPFVFAVHPIENRKELQLLLGSFVAIVLITSLINVGAYLNVFGNSVYSDIRDMSLFLSHIRFALMVTFSAAIAWDWFRNRRFKWRWLGLVICLWFVFYTYYAQVLSGVLSIAGVFTVWLTLEVIRKKNRIITGLAIAFGIISLSGIGYGLYHFFQPPTLKISLENLPEKTKEGNRYYYDKENLKLENGYPVYYFICYPEIKREWEQRSEIPFEGLDMKQQQIEGTLIRYMTSKGMYKDAEGVRALSEEDIRNIEKGIPTILAVKSGLRTRLANLKDEFYYNSDNPNGQSVLQRFIYWRTGWKIFTENWLTGIGAGDVNDAFQTQYKLDDSPLTDQHRLRGHNQFLTFAISYGVIGLSLFVSILVCYWLRVSRNRNWLGLIFMTISILSFLVEDTLETQMGITFFALFFGMYATLRYPLLDNRS